MECYLEGCAKDCVDGKNNPMSFFKISRYVQNMSYVQNVSKKNDLNNQVFIISQISKSQTT